MATNYLLWVRLRNFVYSMTSETQTPYIEVVSRSFTPGHGVKIYGIIPAGAVRFNIKLQCGAEVDALNDIALQITVNIQAASFVVSSLRRGIWDEAETIFGVPVNFTGRFVLGIICDYSHFKIVFNNKFVRVFPQRISYDRVTHLAIDGDITVERTSYEMEPTAPALQTEALKTAAAPFTEGPPPPYSEVQPKGCPPNPMNYGACPLPASSGMSPYPTTATFTPAIPGQKPYPAQQYSYPTNGDTMTPLNAASSNFRPVRPSNRKKILAYGCCIFFALVIVVAGILTKNSKNHHHHHYRVDHGDDQVY